jgi:hypothetical protein
MSNSSYSASPPPGAQRARLDHQLKYTENDAAACKLLQFEELLTQLAAVALAKIEGVVVDDVEIIIRGERLKEQQCDALASKIRSNIPLKKVARRLVHCLFPRQAPDPPPCSCVSSASTLLTSTRESGKRSLRPTRRSSATGA